MREAPTHSDASTRKAGVELYLPLHELELAQHDPNFELVEDYWYWFWKWR